VQHGTAATLQPDAAMLCPWVMEHLRGCKTQSLTLGEHEARGTSGTLMLGTGTGEGTTQHSIGRETGWIQKEPVKTW